MDPERLGKTLGKIGMPAEMRQRVVRRCLESETYEKEEIMMKKTGKTLWRKPAVIAAIVVLLVCVSVTAAALSGHLRDVTRWDGAVVGAVYEQATEEIRTQASVSDGKLAVTVTLLNPGRPPYSACQQLSIASYQLQDGSGAAVTGPAGTEPSPVKDGKAAFSIGLDGLAAGQYTLVITGFTGHAKADQPLSITGSWSCDFWL